MLTTPLTVTPPPIEPDTTTVLPVDAGVTTTADTGDADSASRTARWRADIAKARTARQKLIPLWSVNVDYRRGKPLATESDQDRIPINIDWSAVKAKQAQLFSQVPQVRLTEKSPAYKAAAPSFAKKLNDSLDKARVGVAMDEALPDCINAAGIGGVLVGYEARTEPRTVPVPPPEMVAQLQAAGQPVPMQTVDVPVDVRFYDRRISAADLLIDQTFAGSDFDDSAWIGHSGRMAWPEAKAAFTLKDEDRTRVESGDDRSIADTLISDTEQTRYKSTKVVSYDEVFYWRYKFHTDETRFDAIHRLVFVHGLTEPVVDEPWKGQKRLPNGDIRGACKFPIRVLTLTYISDESIPPSDTAMARPNVDELIASRGQMLAQRKYSIPIRWFDVNGVDPSVQDRLQAGTWQGMIPMNGDGTRRIGEVARASYPREDFEFDRIAKSDVVDAYQVGSNQGGPQGTQIRSASEAQIVQSNFQTRVGYERSRVVRFFVSIAEVHAGLLALYGDFSPEELSQMGVDRETLGQAYLFTVRADSSVLLDAEQRIERLLKFLNMTAKSGYVDVEPIIREIAELSGVDPASVRPPSPPPPEPLNVSARTTGAADLMNPLVMALLIKSGQAPSAQDLAAAKTLLETVSAPPAPPAQPGAPGAPPLGVSGAGAMPAMPMPGGTSVPPGAPGPPPTAPLVPPEAHPQWNPLTRLEKRQDDGKSA